MYEKEINLIDVSFIFLRKQIPGNVFYVVPNCSKSITVGRGGGGTIRCPWLYGPGFLDCWAIGPRVKNSKMITEQSIPYFTYPLKTKWERKKLLIKYHRKMQAIELV